MARPVWMEWVDLFSGMTIPIVVLAATLLYNCSADKRHDGDLISQRNDENRKACLDQQLKLADMICADKARCDVSPRMAEYATGVSKNIQTFCDKAGISIPTGLHNLTTFAVAQGSQSVGATAQVSNALGSVAPSISIASATAPVPLAPQAAKAAPGLAPRVYVQIATEDQRAEALTLIDRVNGAGDIGSSFNGSRLKAIGPELVAASHVGKTQLRCTKKADCAQAGAVATYLGALMGQPPLPILDLSARYESSTAARPFHYELWFAPGPISTGAG